MKGPAARSGSASRSPLPGQKRAAPHGRGARERHSESWEWIKSLAVAVVLFLVIRTFLIQAFTIPSGSMEPTLLVGDYLMANNAVYGAPVPFTDVRTPAFRDPEHGDVVVFRPTYNRPVIDVVKRVIGEPGDTVQMIDRVVYLNGTPLDEPYVDPHYYPDEPIPRTAAGVGLPPEIDPARYGSFWQLEALAPGVDPAQYHPTRDSWGPLVVPAGQYLLLGDNRDQSLDSRYMGFIARDAIVGKAMFIYYSIDPMADRPFPRFLTAARWGRIGRLIR
ncbi:MAG TPA: signal peptidase I [Longimicrobiaceae bacterium]|nr:signal peptidase I [Longimicrobiaceae bacterium]